jgi:hypothetical protein
MLGEVGEQSPRFMYAVLLGLVIGIVLGSFIGLMRWRQQREKTHV